MPTAPSAHPLSQLRFPPASGAIVGGRDEQQDDARIELFEAADRVPALLLIVADGMGGHAGGREASRIAVDAFARTFQAGSGPQLRPRLREALDAANEAVATRAGANRELRGMGCTLVAAVLAGNYLRWISVGDSLLLAIKNCQVVRLNADHSLAPELDRAVREGRISREEAERDPDRSVLRSAVTGGRLNLIDEGARRLGEGALVLLATDGILTLPGDRLAQIASEGKPAERTIEELLSAIEVGMPPDQDNATLVAAYCEGADRMGTRKRRWRRRVLGLIALLAAVLGGALATYILIGGNWQEGENPAKRLPLSKPKQVSPPARPINSGEFHGRVFRTQSPARSERRKSPRPPRPKATSVQPPSPRHSARVVGGNASVAPKPKAAPSLRESNRNPPNPETDGDRKPGIALHYSNGENEGRRR